MIFLVFSGIILNANPVKQNGNTFLTLMDLLIYVALNFNKHLQIVKYDVNFWISKLSEFGPVIGKCPNCSGTCLVWTCSCGNHVRMDLNCPKCGKEAPLTIMCHKCSSFLLNEKGTLIILTEEKKKELSPEILEKFPTCKFCSKKILDSKMFPFKNGTVACIKCIEGFLEAQNGVCKGCMKPIDINKEQISVMENNTLTHSSKECVNLYAQEEFNKKGMMTPLQVEVLTIAIQILSTKDIPTKAEAFDRLLSSELFGGNLWGIKRELQKQRDKETAENGAKRLIEDYYPKFPKEVNNRLQKAGLYSLLDALSIKCLSCGEMIPKIAKICPYCNNFPLIAPVRTPEIRKAIEDPLNILKIRYAKGEITKEEYEEMKNILEGLS